MPTASPPSALDIDRSRRMAREISFESSELSTPCSLASQSTADVSLQDSIMSETDISRFGFFQFIIFHHYNHANIALLESFIGPEPDFLLVFEPSIYSVYSSEILQNTSQLTSRPPLNFGTVITGNLYRSSYPNPENFGYLAELKLRTILYVIMLMTSCMCTILI